MLPISYARHQFPSVIIQREVWLYLRFTLSYRDVEGLLAERGLDVSYETIRRWVLKFGPVFARRLRSSRPRRGARGSNSEATTGRGARLLMAQSEARETLAKSRHQRALRRASEEGER